MNELTLNADQTMSSLALLDLVNAARANSDETQVRRNDFHARCRDELDGEHYEVFVVDNGNATKSQAMRLTRDQCMFVLMRESKSVRRAVNEKLKVMDVASAPTINLDDPAFLRTVLLEYTEKVLCFVSTGVSVAMVWALSTFLVPPTGVNIALTLAAFVVVCFLAVIRRAV